MVCGAEPTRKTDQYENAADNSTRGLDEIRTEIPGFPMQNRREREKIKPV